MKHVYATLGLAATTVLAAISRTSAPAGCSTVGPDGDYPTVQAAVTAAAEGGCIFLAPGTYAEQVYVTTAALTIYGATADVASYAGNTATITAAAAQADGLDDDATGTLRVRGAGFRLYNVDVVNAYGAGSQAVALSAYADGGYYGCSFRGFQDTVLTEQGRQLYAACEIVGATDFVFGQKSMAWFEGCDLRVAEASLGYITANGAASDQASIYVFNNCDIAAAAGAVVAPGAYYLGRPWAAYAYVVYQASTISDVINAAGWAAWTAADPRTDNVTFAVYGNAGAGAAANDYSAAFATTLGAAVAVGDVLGSGYDGAAWYDAGYM